MVAESTMYFSITNWSMNQFRDIGSVGNTVWSLRMVGEYGYEHSLEISRSVFDAEVQITLDVQIGNCLLSKKNALLCERQAVSSFLLDSHNTDNFKKSWLKSLPMNGFVKVRLSKKEAATQTEIPMVDEENPSPSPQLVSDLLHLLESPDSFSDATLVCDSTKIPVHRGILSARSPVFAAMFKIQMQEGREGIVDIVDVEPNALQTMLRYVYSGKTDNDMTPSLAGDLLFAADKYQLEELKMICVDQLKSSMSANNVFRSLALGDLHDKSLKSLAVEFICKYNNFSDLEKTEEWLSLLKERPLLAAEVATTVVKYLQNKFFCT